MKKVLFTTITLIVIMIFQSCDNDSNPVSTEKNILSVLRLNEICNKNETVIKDEDGDAGDWIEIYNGSDDEINIKGLKIKYEYYNNSIEIASEYAISIDFIIPAKGFELIWCDSKNKGLHTNFELKTFEGGRISLLDSEGETIDSFNFTESPLTYDDADVSLAYYPQNGLDLWRMFGPGYELWPTPRQDNFVEIQIPTI